jgi:Ca2+-binding RTX toxin-like protein
MVKVLHGTAGNDLLLGDQLDNNVFLDLGAGRDIAIGGAKNDRFVMTTVDHGVDRIDGGAGEDTIDFRASDHALHINLASGEVDANFGGSNPFNIFNPPQWAEVAEVRNVEDVVGSRFDDSITGSAADNRLDGGAGNDVIHAGAGNDTLIGGIGNNVLDGGTGSDTADYSSSSHMVIASLQGGVAGEVEISSTAPAQEFSHDTLVSIENLTGSAQGDWLMGDANANVINGGGGDDQLDGHGGGGHDTFAFMDFTESHDLVMDFHIGEDKLAIVGNDTMADLHFTQTGAGTVVSFDNSQTTITLLGVNAQDFVAHSSTDIVFSQTLDPLMHG